MYTDSAHRAIHTTEPSGAVTRAIGQVQQFLCGLHGHDALLHFEQGRISLQCTSCSFETPGWDLKTRGDVTASPRHRVSLPLVSERRVA